MKTMSTDVAISSTLKSSNPEQVFIDESFFSKPLRAPIVYPPKEINKTKIKQQQEKKNIK